MTVPTGPIERHLAAIVAADVVGYSRLMGADEKGTLVALKAHRTSMGMSSTIDGRNVAPETARLSPAQVRHHAA